MRRALELARHGELDAHPNPMVGAVVVAADGRIIGEGWHRKCGEGHAEVNAIASVAPADQVLLGSATIYVTLEPCSHFGKTPPCADLIVRTGIPRVVVGALDPFEKVAGRGIKRLQEAGVEVTTGVLADECEELNRRFFTAHRLRRPYIQLKWAQSADGYIDGAISTPLSLVAMHRERALADAIIIGSGTALADSPSLTVRSYAGRSPQRVVLDRRGRIDSSSPLHAAVMACESVEDVVKQLYSQNVTSVMVEGGAQVLQSFLDAGLWDEIRIEQSPAAIHGSVKAPNLPPMPSVYSVEPIGPNKILTYRKS